MEKVNANSYMFDKAPAKIVLTGDKTKGSEKAQHIIEFPGGAVEVSRTSDGNYWAHIIINQEYADPDYKGMHHRLGVILSSRIDSDTGIIDVPNQTNVTQVAILIGPGNRREG